MSRFRRVDGARAGPEALGVLVAPGSPTLVILRPRALAFDLLPVRATLRNGLGDGFRDMDRAEAAELASVLAQSLAEGAACLGPIPAAGDGYWVQAEVGPCTLLACRRQPGQPYRAHVFATLEEARDMAAALRPILCPPAEAAQELYLNSDHFSHGPG